MSTSDSPIEKLTAEADKIATVLHEQYKAKKFIGKPTTKIGIVMDDKVITLEMRTETIGRLPHHALSSYVLKLMQEHEALK